VNQVSDQLKEHVRELKAEIIQELRSDLSDLIEDFIDGAVDEYFKNEDMDCWLRFDEDNGPHVLIGIGPGNMAASFAVELDGDCYAAYGGVQSEEQLEDVVEQIGRIKRFIAELEGAVRNLEAHVRACNGKQLLSREEVLANVQAWEALHP
jgi:hypothetical protein